MKAKYTLSPCCHHSHTDIDTHAHTHFSLLLSPLEHLSLTLLWPQPLYSSLTFPTDISFHVRLSQYNTIGEDAKTADGFPAFTSDITITFQRQPIGCLSLLTWSVVCCYRWFSMKSLSRKVQNHQSRVFVFKFSTRTPKGFVTSSAGSFTFWKALESRSLIDWSLGLKGEGGRTGGQMIHLEHLVSESWPLDGCSVAHSCPVWDPKSLNTDPLNSLRTHCLVVRPCRDRTF